MRDGEVTPTVIDPADHGIARNPVESLRGGDAAHNAEVVRRMLAGETGAVRDAVLLNAGAALAVYDAGEGSVGEQLQRGLDRATEAVDSGAAAATLERWVAASGS